MYPPKQESESEDLDDLAKLDYIISNRKNSAKHSPAGSIQRRPLVRPEYLQLLKAQKQRKAWGNWRI